jgi:L-lactate dehydrogenase
MPDKPSKIAIIGAGSVGATIAYACLIRGVGKSIALYDTNAAKVKAETLDLNHGLQFVPMATLEGSTDLEICRDADVLVITAGAKQKPGQTRMDLASANTAICKALIAKLLAVAPNAILLMVTNPVDVITYVTLKISGLPRNRVLGSGTVLDSSRFRFLIAQRLKVAVQNVHASPASTATARSPSGPAPTSATSRSTSGPSPATASSPSATALRSSKMSKPLPTR